MKKMSANEVLHSDCQWYLFEQLWPFCSSPSADSVCPKPTVPNSTYVVEMQWKRKLKMKKKKKKKKEKKKKKKRKRSDLL